MTETSQPGCTYCGAPVPGSRQKLAPPQNRYCCAGCIAAEEFKSLLAPAPQDFADFRQPSVLAEVASPVAPDLWECRLFIEDLECSSCSVPLHKHLLGLHGLAESRFSIPTRTVTVRWRAAETGLADILESIGALGFSVRPVPLQSSEVRADTRQKTMVRRLGVAALGAMQVMMYASAFYFTDPDSIPANIESLLRYASLIMTAPVVAYSGLPFLTGALRDLRHGRAGMDVPIALGVVSAFLISAWHTFAGRGIVYFDSVAMFVFLILLGRYWEQRGREQAVEVVRVLAALQPITATRLAADGRIETIARGAIQPGDKLLVKPGESFPVDGTIVNGSCQVNEALLTGEAMPKSRKPGDQVLAGTVDTDTPVTINADRVGSDTFCSHLLVLAQQALEEKPHSVKLADAIAGYFVLAVLAIAAVAGGVWSALDPSRMLEVILAVLVVTCPCALSLATPVALAAAASRLAREGLIVTRGRAVEQLSRATDVVFDKTGTLTHSVLRVAQVRALAGRSTEEVLALAGQLERSFAHPIARALTIYAPELSPDMDARLIDGRGVEGRLRNHRYSLTAMDADQGADMLQDLDAALTWLVLREDDNRLALIGMEACARAEATVALRELSARGIGLHLLSGDAEGPVRALAKRLGIARHAARQLPAQKLEAVRKLQGQGRVVLMVGDGINDVPVLGGADVSIAMNSGAAFAHASADMVLIRENLRALPVAVDVARRTRRIIRQNLSWAVAYNMLVLPLAVTGHLTPWLAALGMSMSSLLVVGNALRLLQRPSEEVSSPSRTLRSAEAMP